MCASVATGKGACCVEYWSSCRVVLSLHVAESAELADLGVNYLPYGTGVQQTVSDPHSQARPSVIPSEDRSLASDDTAVRQGTVPDSELTLLLEEIARGKPWREAMEGRGLPTIQRKRRWFLDSDKARLYRQLPTPSRRRALDVGAGSGVLSHGLAEHFEHVVALEQHAGFCAFMRARFRQDNIPHAVVVQGNALNLPFAPRSFDLIVINGVLEWIPEARTDVNPRQVQLAFLRDIRELLAENGTIAIAIENRWYVRALQGFSPHGEPPYAVVLPRRIAQWYSRLARGTDYRTWIYGSRGYRKLMTDAGFRAVDVQPVVPDYHNPQRLLALADGTGALPYFSAKRAIAGATLRALALTGALGHLVHSFYVTARR
jgi:SAM-dependent methyltransferase